MGICMGYWRPRKHVEFIAPTLSTRKIQVSLGGYTIRHKSVVKRNLAFLVAVVVWEAKRNVLSRIPDSSFAGGSSGKITSQSGKQKEKKIYSFQTKEAAAKRLTHILEKSLGERAFPDRVTTQLVTCTIPKSLTEARRASVHLHKKLRFS